MSAELEQKFNEAIGELRSTAKAMEQKGANITELQTKMDKINVVIDGYEKKNAELMGKIAASENQAEEIKSAQERIRELEIKAAKTNDYVTAGVSPKYAEELKAFKGFLENPDVQLDKKFMQLGSNVNGGFLMQELHDEEILKPNTEISAFRQFAKVKQESVLRSIQTTRDTLITGHWVAEGESPTSSNSTYGQRGIVKHEKKISALISDAAMVFSGNYDMRSELTGDMAEKKNEMDDLAFTLGAGVATPHGIITRLIAESRLYASGDADELTWDAIVKMTGKIKHGYTPVYMMNGMTAAVMRTLKTGDGAGYAWTPGDMKAGIPNTIAGYGYVIMPQMADIAENAYPLAFADIRKCYTIKDGKESMMKRIEQDNGTKFILTTWTGGDVVMPEAGIVMKCATSI